MKVTRYTVYRPEGDGYVLALGAQGRWTWRTAEAAQAWLDAALENSPHQCASAWNCDPAMARVLPVECWAEHFDPCGIYAVPQAASRAQAVAHE